MASTFSRGWISKSFLLQYWHSGDVWQPQRDVANLHGKWVKCTKSVGRTTWQPSTQTLITFLTCVFSYLCIIMTYIAWWNAWRMRSILTIREYPNLAETISIYIYPYGGAFGSMPPLGRSATAASQLVHTQQFKLCIRHRCSITYHTQTKQLQPFRDLDSNNEKRKLQLQVRRIPNKGDISRVILRLHDLLHESGCCVRVCTWAYAYVRKSACRSVVFPVSHDCSGGGGGGDTRQMNLWLPHTYRQAQQTAFAIQGGCDGVAPRWARRLSLRLGLCTRCHVPVPWGAGLMAGSWHSLRYFTPRNNSRG